MTAEHRKYVQHVAACETAAHGRWCNECWDLVRDADAECWKRAAERAKQWAAR